MKRDRLGRGLGSLLEAYLGPESLQEQGSVPVAAISPNPMQPRRTFDESELEELRASIERHGLIQPLVVRAKPGAAGEFELIAGERRFRAVTALGWIEVPAVRREASDETLLVLALVENLQRQELNPLEEAEGYRTLAAEYGLSQEEIARTVHKSRPTVANSLRLLRLPNVIKDYLRIGQLTMGHARALLAVPDPERAVELGRRAASEGWSVRKTEEQARRAKTPRRPPPGRKPPHPMFQTFEEAMADSLSTPVTIQRRSGARGQVRISYASLRELEGIVELVTGRSLESIAD